MCAACRLAVRPDAGYRVAFHALFGKKTRIPVLSGSILQCTIFDGWGRLTGTCLSASNRLETRPKGPLSISKLAATATRQCFARAAQDDVLHLHRPISTKPRQ